MTRSSNLTIRRIDAHRDDLRAAMAQLRRRLSPRGDVVSQEGRRRTVEIFGEPLAPAAVVERICRDVGEKGLAAVLDYSARIDRAALAADALRVPAEELARAHAAAAPEFLQAIRHVRENIRGVSGGDSAARRARGSARRLPGPAVSAAGADRRLCAGWGRSVSLDCTDDRRSGPGCRGARDRRSRPSHAIRGVQRRSVGHVPRVGCFRGLPPGRSAGRGRAGLRRRGPAARRQDRRSRKPLRRPCQEARLWRRGHRLDRRPQ